MKEDHCDIAAAPVTDFDIGEFLPFINCSNSRADEILETLTKSARGPDGRANLAKSHTLPAVLLLIQRLSSSSNHRNLLLSSLRLLRNLCAGEISNQNSFISNNGVDAILLITGSVLSELDPDCDIIRMCLQVLGNVALAGREHQLLIWRCLFPDRFAEIARFRRIETCDPLCMVVYTCCNGNQRLFDDLCDDIGLTVVAEVICSASGAGFEDAHWLKMLLSSVCFRESYFHLVFSKLHMVSCSKFKDHPYLPEHSYLLAILSDVLLNCHRDDSNNIILLSTDFALQVLQILKEVVGAIDFFSKIRNKLPTGEARIDILGHSLVILRFICAQDGNSAKVETDVVEALIHADIIDTLLNLLRELGPPPITRKAAIRDVGTPARPKTGPYRGFRRDVVAVIGNCCHRRIHVQNEIRNRDGILLLLQQCVVDEDNPFLREWGVWCLRNLLEGNSENQCLLSELELLGPVNLPEITELGFHVKVDQRTQRPTLVNISS